MKTALEIDRDDLLVMLKLLVERDAGIREHEASEDPRLGGRVLSPSPLMKRAAELVKRVESGMVK